jgi:GMP synthase (glutamine-hydrolysing)
MKPLLILQLRVLDGPADGEFRAFLNYGGLSESEVHRIRMEKESIADIDPKNYAAIIVGGGPSNISDDESIKPDYQIRFENELKNIYPVIFENDIPFLGSCYGFGSIARYAGARISKERYNEAVGSVTIHLRDAHKNDPLLKGLPPSFDAFTGHKEACQNLPEEATLLASSDDCPIQMIRFKENIYAMQFHCELDAEGLASRIRYYKNHGYFEPHAADALIEANQHIIAHTPQVILKRFVERYLR